MRPAKPDGYFLETSFRRALIVVAQVLLHVAIREEGPGARPLMGFPGVIQGLFMTASPQFRCR